MKESFRVFKSSRNVKFRIEKNTKGDEFSHEEGKRKEKKRKRGVLGGGAGGGHTVGMINFPVSKQIAGSVQYATRGKAVSG